MQLKESVLGFIYRLMRSLLPKSTERLSEMTGFFSVIAGLTVIVDWEFKAKDTLAQQHRKQRKLLPSQI
jgi:hypothetical protein